MRLRFLYWIAGTVIFLAAAGWGVYQYWFRDVGIRTSAVRSASTPAESQEGKVPVTLYLPAAGSDGLREEKRELPDSPQFEEKAAAVLGELLKGNSESREGLFPRGTKVLAVFWDPRGIVYVDLSKEATQGNHLGPWAEALRVYAVVNTMAANFPGVKRVKILVEGQEVENLAGHVSLQEPLEPKTEIVQPAAGATGSEPPKF